MNPEQMRALADRAHAERSAFGFRTVENDLEDALRAAADQLEAVQAYFETERMRALFANGTVAWALMHPEKLNAILTADTAPQEDRDE